MEDVRVERMRYVRWQPALAIPGFTVTEASPGKVRPNPRGSTDRWYAERARAIQEFVASSDFRRFIGARDGLDRLVPDFDSVDANPTFRQDYVAGTEVAHLFEGTVTIHLTQDGNAIEGLTISFREGFSPDAVAISAGEALEIVAEEILELGLPTTTPSDMGFLVGRRDPWNVSLLQRGAPGDRLLRRVLFYDPAAPSFRRIQVLVNASDGSIDSLQPFAADQDTASWGSFSAKMPGDAYEMAYPWLVSKTDCMANEGFGLDVNGHGRSFSTSTGLGYVIALGSGINPFFMVSCDEAPPRDIHFRDVATFWLDPNLNNDTKFKFWGWLFPLMDGDDNWSEPDPNAVHRQGVNSQYWGERILRYFRRHGFTTRKLGAADFNLVPWNSKPKPPEPYRFWGWHDTMPLAAEAAVAHLVAPEQVGTYTFKVPNLGFEAGGGVIQYGGAGELLTTGGDPAFLAHEFAHTLTWDRIWYPALPNLALDEGAIAEGLSDCFAMLFLRSEGPWNLGFGYNTLGEEWPFHLGAGAYHQEALAWWGFRNLDAPQKSLRPKKFAGERSRTWAGDFELKNGRHSNSTLLSGACKLLITGGHNPEFPDRVVTPGGLTNSISLGWQSSLVNRSVAYERLEELLFGALLDGKIKSGMTFEELRGALAAKADQLNSSKWSTPYEMGEKVSQAFGAYGFGRLEETEPNSAIKIAPLDNDAAKNVIGVGKNRQRDIKGSVCLDDKEDVFVLNEKVMGSHAAPYDGADTIDFKTSGVGVADWLDVRVYRDKPCEEEKEEDYRPCAKAHQVYPPVDDKGVWSFTAINGNFNLPLDPTDIPPAPGSEWRKIFVAVRLKSCVVDYKVSVQITHQSPFY